ncbi:hypothetical protein LCGC14_2844960, partial [marine sediment metagenome]
TVQSSATQDILNRHGGWWRMVIAGDEADAVMLAGERVFEIDEGSPVIFEVRLRTSDSNVSAIWVGLTDDPVESLAIPYTVEDGTGELVTATDQVGFLLEGETDETWQAVGAQNGTGNTAEALTTGPDSADDTTITLRMELWPDDGGTVEYSINGKLVATKTNWFRSGILFCPAVACDDRGTAFNLDIDYIFCTAPRGAT